MASLAAGVCLAASGALLTYLAKCGWFSKLVLTEETFGPYMLLHVNAQGPYKTAYQHCKELRRLVIEEARLDCEAEYNKRTAVGIYFDDPSCTPASKCRFSMAVVQDTHGSTDIDGYAQSLQSQLSVCKSGELKVGKFPESRCLAIKLPNFGTLSIMNAVYRAYPFLIKEARRKLGKEQADQAIASGMLEVYRMQENVMWVVLPLTRRTTMLPFSHAT